MEEGLRSLRETRARARETPNAANQVQYPEDFNNSVPVIIATAMQKTRTATIIVATQSPGYTEDSFNTDVRKTVDYFKLLPDMYHVILLKPVREDLEVLDAADATDKLRRVVEELNRSTVLYMNDMRGCATTELRTGETTHNRFRGEVIITTFSTYTLRRIVSLGVATSGFIFKALEYIVNGWHAPNKSVQFVTNGEVEDGKFLKFWTSACLH
jgi:hypothetical protein